MLITRIGIAVSVCALLVAWAWHSAHSRHPAVQRAEALLGERWYELALNGEHLGYWFTRSRRDVDGRWIFESEQRSALSAGDPVTVSNRRVFAATPPHDLLEAEYRETRRQWWEGTRIERADAGYEGTFLQAGSAARTPVALDWSYRLIDYLDFEAWLHEAAPPPGTARTIATLDFSRMQIVPRKLEVTGRDATGFRIENPAPHANTTIQLDHNYAPVKVRLAGLFDLTLSTRARALAPRTALQRESYYVPVDRPLANHTRLKRLELSVNASVPADKIWPGSERRDDEWRLVLDANPLSPRRRAARSAEALGFPSEDPRIRQLARSAVADAATATERLSALVGFVHNYLSYEPGGSPLPVLALLDEPRGDCTEFADLFTTLARSLGIPTHTVFGLAYSDGNDPAFNFHAWNEVFVDGAWRPVDPTWNQLSVDATHIPLPGHDNAALLLLTGAVQMSFELRDSEYFD